MLPITVYQTALNTSPIGQYFLSPSTDPVFLEVNETFLTIVGLMREEIIGKKLFEVFSSNPDDPLDTGVEKFKESLERVIQTGKKDTLDIQRYPIKTKLRDGSVVFEERFWNASSIPIYDEKGQLLCISHQTMDVTEKIYAEIALKKSESRYRSLTESIDEGFCVLEVFFDKNNNPIDYLFHEVNPVFEAQTGLKDAAGKTVREMVPDFEQVFVDLYGTVAKTGKSVRFENFSKTLDRIFDVYAYPIDEPGENMVGVLFRDITKKKQQEESLRQSESRLRALITATADAIYRMSPDWSELHHLEGRGFLKNVTNTQKFWLDEYVPTTDHEILHSAIAKAISNKSKLQVEVRVNMADGSMGWVETRAIPMLDEQGNIIEWLGTSSDITARKLAVEELQEAGRLKDDFLAMLAHELRNPLSPISSAAELLSFVKFDEDRVQHCSDIISRQVKHLTSLVNDLLDVSRVTRGLITLDMDKIDLTEIIAYSAEQVRPLIESHKHQISYGTPMHPILIRGDKHRLIQIITNILNNAAKYTPAGGSIKLTLDIEGESARIVITDNGIGMEANLIKRAFELFTQASRSSDRSQGGLGIGLALVKSLVELHQGKVTITSSGIGMGSQVTILLPLIKTESVKEPLDNRSDILNPTEINTATKVMVVDDNVDAADMTAILLEMSGYEVVAVYSSLEALKRSTIEKPSIFILDIGLPDMDGKELARNLRAQPETQNAMLIALTGYSEDQELVNAKEAGFDNYFVKPVDSSKLLALMNNLKASGNDDENVGINYAGVRHKLGFF